MENHQKNKFLIHYRFLDLDIESEDKDLVRIEYSPNRPDYSTDFGIALGMQGLLGIKTGAIKLKIKKSNNINICKTRCGKNPTICDWNCG